MKFILLAAFLAVANARSVITDEEKCTFGPSYWCKNAQTGKQCNAVKYCVEHVWLKQFKATSCDECKEVVGVVHSYLADPTTDAEILSLLEAACSEFGSCDVPQFSCLGKSGKKPDGTTIKYPDPTECHHWYECLGGVARRYKCFQSGKRFDDSEQICVKGTCNPVIEISDVQLKKPEKTIVIECELCGLIMKTLNPLLLNIKTEKELVVAMSKLCSSFPDAIVRDECNVLINKYGKGIIQLIVEDNFKPRKICKELKLCVSQHLNTVDKPHKVKKRHVSSFSVECMVCEFVMRELGSMVTSNSTEQEIISALDKVCGLLPSSYGKECVSLVSDYGKAIINLIMAAVSPNMICNELRLCSK